MATQPVDPQLRKIGIGVVGDVPWGSHFFMFYETKEDLLDTLVPYFKAGLESGELCLWVVSEPLTEGRGEECPAQGRPRIRALSGGPEHRDCGRTSILFLRQRSRSAAGHPDLGCENGLRRDPRIRRSAGERQHRVAGGQRLESIF